MANTIFADVDIEGIIWLVIIVIWVLAQMLNAARNAQKKRDQRGSVPAPRGDSERQEPKPPPVSLPDFLEDILQQQQPKPVKPKRRKPPVPVRSDYQKLKPIPRKSKASDTTVPAADEACYYDHKQQSDFIMSTGMESFKLPIVRLPSLKNCLSMTKTKRKSRMNLNLRDRASFKRAVISRTVLGPPKALQGEAYLSRD